MGGMSRPKLRGALCALLLLALAACRREATRDDAVRALLSADPASLSLLGKMDVNTELVAAQITDSLVQYDAHLALVPRVAESWTVADDRRTVTFRLRDGVRWHDGRPVVAEDVVFSVEAARRPATENRTYASLLGEIESLRAIDERTVEARYRTMSPDFLEAWRLPLLPKHLAGADADLLTGEFASHPIGCGPFRFVSYRNGQEIVLERNDDYWDGRPDIERLVLKIYPDQQTGFQALLLGELDLMRVSADLLQQAREAPDAKRLGSLVYWPLSVWPVMWNLEGNPFFGDARVRRALVHALDRDEFVEVVAHGQARTAVTTYHPDTEWADPTLAPRAYDPDLAARLLEEAGWTDSDGDGVRDKDGRPFRFTLLVPDSTMQLLQQIVVWQQHAWAAIGVAAEIERLEWQAFRERRDAGRFDAASFSISLTPSPDQFDLYHSSSRENGFNVYGLHDAAVDSLCERGRAEFDPDRRREIYRELQRILHEQEYVSAMFHFATPVLHDAGLAGLAGSPLGLWVTVDGPRRWHWTRPE
jgi:peptide/nickel transport system substrate-binding protein